MTDSTANLSVEALLLQIQELRERAEDIADREDCMTIQAAKAKQGSRPGNSLGASES